MIKHNVSTALLSGYDVILEGILTVKSYQNIIEKIINSHQGESYIFYFNTSFNETIRRHQSKIGNFNYSSKEIKKWYLSSHKSDHKLETLIPETYSINQTINKIIKMSGINVRKVQILKTKTNQTQKGINQLIL